MSAMQSLSTPETVTNSNILVDAVIPYQIIPVNSKLVEELKAQLAPMIKELASEFSAYDVSKYVASGQERELIKVFQKGMTELARAFAEEEKASEMMINTIDQMCSVSAQLFKIIRNQSGRSQYNDQELKIVSLVGRAGKISSEIKEAVEQGIPSTTTLTIHVVGNLADLNTVGEKLRKRAIELVREAQVDGAEDNGWQVVRNGDGSIARYRPPLGSHAQPVHPALDVDDPVQALQALSNLKKAAIDTDLASLMNSIEF